MAAAALYTAETLALATSLARWPLDPALPLTGTARSPTCGSTIAIGLACDANGHIERVGIRAHACAIGQAAAAVFAKSAAGRDRAAVAVARDGLAAWLTGEVPLPDWPGLAAIAPARDFPARHGAILLPWTAALAALPSP